MNFDAASKEEISLLCTWQFKI